ncbi:hypothetical protein GQR58_010475 [Nymphon striatum]|nr:hypothetical protein GQR58_010475 [Nymphon striatum]
MYRHVILLTLVNRKISKENIVATYYTIIDPDKYGSICRRTCIISLTGSQLRSSLHGTKLNMDMDSTDNRDCVFTTISTSLEKAEYIRKFNPSLADYYIVMLKLKAMKCVAGVTIKTFKELAWGCCKFCGQKWSATNVKVRLRNRKKHHHSKAKARKTCHSKLNTVSEMKKKKSPLFTHELVNRCTKCSKVNKHKVFNSHRKIKKNESKSPSVPSDKFLLLQKKRLYKNVAASVIQNPKRKKKKGSLSRRLEASMQREHKESSLADFLLST